MRAFTLLTTLLPFVPLSSAQYLRPRVLPRDSESSSSESDFDWSSITPSSSLEWKKCYKEFSCARLQVPLDYGDHSKGNTSIAFLKVAAKNATSKTKDLIYNPGGPGYSSTDVIQFMGSQMQELFGADYNFIGFAPRGVGESGPSLDCWPNHPERRGKFEDLFYTDLANSSSTALNTQYYSGKLFGQACSEAVGGVDGNASFISTPAVAQDLLTYAKAERIAAGKSADDAKLNFFGVSYGTVLGATFASMYPDKVERMVLDGVFSLSDYYSGAWKTGVDDSDKELDAFCKYCYQAGKENCSFWGPSVSNITTRLNNVFTDLKYNPIPIPSSKQCEVPTLATYSYLKQSTFAAMYTSASFPPLADALSGLEQRNTSGYLELLSEASGAASPCSNGTSAPSSDKDPRLLIQCVDSWDGLKFDDLEQYRDYINDLEERSPFFGEVWPLTAGHALCQSLDVKPPKSARVTGSMMETRNTSFPILFVTSKLDPATPKGDAHKMSSVFPGSAVLEQASLGHGVTEDPSQCTKDIIKSYMNGHVPRTNETCPANSIPFKS